MLIVPARVIVIAMRTEDHGCLPYYLHILWVPYSKMAPTVKLNAVQKSLQSNLFHDTEIKGTGPIVRFTEAFVL